MDQLHRQISLAFPDHTITHIEVCQSSGTSRLLRIKIQGRHSPLLLKSFLNERHPVVALIETSLHDAEDLGLTLPYEQITGVLLAACKNIAAKTTDPALILKGAGVPANSAGIRPPRPGIEGCLLRGNETLAGVISRSKERRLTALPNGPLEGIDHEKTL